LQDCLSLRPFDRGLSYVTHGSLSLCHRYCDKFGAVERRLRGAPENRGWILKKNTLNLP